VESTCLHHRLALVTLKFMGAKEHRLLLGVMGTTFFFSMWISNTATAATMVPVVMALTTELIHIARESGMADEEKGQDVIDVQSSPAVTVPQLPSNRDASFDSSAANTPMTGSTAPTSINGNPSFTRLTLKSVSEEGVEGRTDVSASAAPSTNPVCDSPPGERREEHREIFKSSFSLSREELSRHELGLCKAMLLGVAYSASIGGSSTLTGTPPNVVLLGLLNDKYGTAHPVDFASWMGFSLPACILNLLLTFLWLRFAYLRPYKRNRPTRTAEQQRLSEDRFRAVLTRELDRMGSISFGESSTIMLFLVLLTLWLTRSLVWGRWFTDRSVNEDTGAEKEFSTVSDATSAMLVVFVMFLWPREMPQWAHNIRNMVRRRGRAPEQQQEQQQEPASSSSSSSSNGGSRRTLLTWPEVEKKVAWGIVILLGGGFALGHAVKRTGLSKLIGMQLLRLNVSPPALMAIAVILMTFTTEFTSNTATSAIVLPIILEIAQQRCINPLYMAMPVAQAACFAFMLPIATGPNAIVFSSGLMHVIDMMAAGLIVNIFCMVVAFASANSLGFLMYSMAEYPSWALTESGIKCTDPVTNGTAWTLISGVDT